MAINKKHPATARYVNASDAVQIQDVNYTEGNTDSVAQSIVRHFEDFFKEFEQNKHTSGYVVSRTDASTIAITAGEAMVEGLWMRNATQFNLDITGFDSGTYYVCIDSNRASGTETSRNPTSDGVTITLIASGSLDLGEHHPLAKVVMAASGTLGVSEITEDYSADYSRRVDRIYGYNKAHVGIYTGIYPAGYKIAQFSGTSIDLYGNTTISGTLVVSGAITPNSTVDGRDIAVDGTKLDTIETSATADQSQADIEGLGFVTGAHTVKYLDSEAIAAVEGEASLALSTGVTFNTVGFEAFNAIGSGNARFIAPIYAGNNNYGNGVEYNTSTPGYTSAASTTLIFAVPLPATKGTMDLFLGDVKFYMEAADGSNYVSNINVYKYHTGSGTETLVHTSSTNRTATGEVVASFTPSNVSASDQFFVQILLTQAVARSAVFNGLLIEYYYA